MIAAALLGVVPAHAQGIGYEVAPVVTQLRWDNALGLSNDYLYGARVGVSFGPFLGLQGYYLTRSGLQFDPSVLIPAPGAVPVQPQQQLDVRSVGANLIFNLGSGSTVPFLRGGAGVLRLTPDGLDHTDQILLRAGGGLRFNIAGGFGGEVFAEDWAFRLNRYRLFSDETVPVDGEADRLRHNLAIGASVNVPLGGASQDPGLGLRGTTIPIEPFGGRLRFADELGLGDQDVVGIRAGVDFSRLVGLRGFYWRGVTPRFNELEPIQGYGGEVQFNLGSGPGIFPYLVGGAGQLDFRSGYGGEEMITSPSNRVALIVGGGAGITLSDRIRANVAIRDYIFGEETLEDVRRTDQLLHNPMLTAGLTFAIGGSPPAGPRLREDRERLQAETERLRAENERLRQQVERREAQIQERDPQLTRDADGVVIDTVVQRTIEQREQRTITLPVPERGEIYIRFGEPGGVRIERGGAEAQSMAVPSAATLPDPQGLSAAELQEVIRQAVREEMQREARLQAGATPAAAVTPAPATAAPAAVITPAPATAAPAAMVAPSTATTVDAQRLSAAELQEVVRQAVREERQRDAALRASAAPAAAVAAVPANGTTDQQLAQMEARLARRIDEIVSRRLAEQDRRIPVQQAGPSTVVVVPETAPAPVPVAPAPAPPAAVEEAGSTVYVVRERHRLRPHRTRLYSGLSFDGTNQLLLGARVNLGPITPRIPLAFVPSIAVGLGGETSVMVAGNLQFDAPPIGTRFAIEPHAAAGLGLLSRGGIDPVVNLGYGASALLGDTRFGMVRAFAEHQGIALFGRHRVLVGLQMDL